MPFSLWSVCLVVLAVSPVFSQSCSLINVGGHDFDFTTESGHYLQGAKLPDGNRYYLSLCENIPAPSNTCPDGSCVGYQIDGVGSCWCLGQASQVSWQLINSTLQVLYTGGSKRSFSQSCSALFNIECAETESMPDSVEEPPNTFQYTFTWKTPVACLPTPKPKPSSGSGGGSLSGVAVFDIIFFVSIAAFIAFGSLYKWKVKGESGSNVIPFKSFWVDIPFLVKDGTLFVVGVLKTTFYKLTGKAESI